MYLVVIQGKIIMSNDIDYWLANSFKYPFQDTSSFIQIGGTDVNIYGGGEIDGNGQAWWDARMDNKSQDYPMSNPGHIYGLPWRICVQHQPPQLSQLVLSGVQLERYCL